MDDKTNGQTDETQSVSRIDIVYIFQAYSRHELTYDELIEQTRAWAEAMRRQYGEKCYTERVNLENIREGNK